MQKLSIIFLFLFIFSCNTDNRKRNSKKLREEDISANSTNNNQPDGIYYNETQKINVIGVGEIVSIDISQKNSWDPIIPCRFNGKLNNNNSFNVKDENAIYDGKRVLMEGVGYFNSNSLQFDIKIYNAGENSTPINYNYSATTKRY